MFFKPDWEQAKERFRAWWEGEVIDRVAMAVKAPRNEPLLDVPVPETPDDPRRLHADPEYLVQLWEASFSRTYFGAEAIPTRTVLVGYAAMGTPVTFHERTIWSEPVIDDYATDLPIWDTKSEAWQTVVACTNALQAAGRDRWLVSYPTVLDPTDNLSNLRGNQRLCVDFHDRPDDVRRAVDYFTGIWFRAYGELSELIEADRLGSTGWLPLWSPGKSTTIQCDFSCLVGAEMFREFVVPELRCRAQWLDNCIYHLDGPGAIHHLDTVLEIPEIKGIQWVPGEGQPGCVEWMDLLRRVQDAGKLLDISIPPGDVETALNELRPEGLFLHTSAGSVEEADALIDRARKLTSARS